MDNRRLEQLSGKLDAASKSLNESVGLIKVLDFDVVANVRRVGDALAEIIEIQLQLYHLRPDLAPKYMRDKFPLTGTDRLGEPE